MCRKSETLKALDKSVLYQSRYKHPVIDVIGILEDERHVWWLVFLQISLSPYSSHHSKLIDLFKHHVCPELTADDDTLYEYYIAMCEDVVPIYVYLSPKEVYEEGYRELIRRRSKENVNFAVIPKGSDTSKEVEIVASIRM